MIMANSNHRISIESLLLPNCPSFSCQAANFSFPPSLPAIPKTLSNDHTSSSPSSPIPGQASSSKHIMWLPRDPNSNTKRKGRTTSFSHAQKTILNGHFKIRENFQSYTTEEIGAIEKETGLSKTQIRIYFQNKRARKKAKAGAPIRPQQSPNQMRTGQDFRL